MIDDRVIKLILDVVSDKVKTGKVDVGELEAALKKIPATADAAADGVEKVGRAAGKAKTGTADFGQSAMQAGRFIQDFQAAGVMGIANNLEGLSMALGGGAGLAGGLTILATAWLAFGPQIKEFFRSFGDAGKEGLATTVEGLNKQLAEAKDRIKEMGEAGVTTAGQMGEYLKLRERAAEIEKRVADQMQRQKDIEALRARKEPGADEQQAARKKALDASLTTDDVASLTAGVASQMAGSARQQAQNRAREKDAAAAVPGLDPVVRDTLRREAAEARKRASDIDRGLADDEFRRGAENVVGPAAQGGEAQIEFLQALMRDTPQAFTDAAREHFAKGTQGGVNRARAGKVLGKLKEEFKQAVGKQVTKDKADEATVFGEEWDKMMAEFGKEDAKAKGGAEMTEKNRAETAKRFRAGRDDAVKAMEATPLDEQAAAAAAQYQAQEGVYNPRTKRVDKADEITQLKALAEDLDAKIARTAEGQQMSDPMRAAVATRMAMNAFDTVGDATRRRQAELSQGGLKMNEAGQQAVAEVLATMNSIAQQQAQSAAGWGVLAQQARSIRGGLQGGKR